MRRLADTDITLIGCWAHARRKFDEACKAQGKKTHAKTGKAMMGLSYIRKRYRVEKTLKDQSPEQRHRAREQQAKPIVQQLRRWLDQSLGEVLPGTLNKRHLCRLIQSVLDPTFPKDLTGLVGGRGWRMGIIEIRGFRIDHHDSRG